MPTLGAIADDFTGATDLATTLVARGFRTVVTVGPAPLVPPPAGGGGGEEDAVARAVLDADAVVVALKSRSAPVEEAVGDSLAALEGLRAAGCTRFYFKYCSTFDSTPQGNIGPVTDVLLDALGATGPTVVVPSFPATGRTVADGLLYVHGEPLERSPMRHHPLTPMRDSDVVRLLSPQTRRPVALVALGKVREGEAALRDALNAPELSGSLVVVDAVTEEDLGTIAAATADHPLVTGAAGLAVGLLGPRATAAAAPDPDAARAPAASRPGDPALVLSGSASSATRAQVAHARDAGLPSRKLDLDALRADFGAAVEDLVGFARSCWEESTDRPPLLYAVGDPADLETGDGDTAPGGVPASALVEKALAACAKRLVAAGARRVLVAGGETSGAVVTALAVRALAIGAPIAPGVTWASARSRVDGREREVDLALKSGNFGSTDIFTEAWSTLA
ncbi:3-oxo-tetronate kinase [Streptomyces sp. NPDC088768]|uniref:3-oxo-tetronate kinase n=1 Tax=Streptomyces sp. NPDC088768 TaxID=3365894 RepID=UPI00380EEB40